MSDARLLRELRTTRRRRRLQEMEWIDALYRVYLTAIFGIVAVVAASGALGDDPATASQLTQVTDRGPAWVGLGIALALAVALRSGSRGGPLAMEAAEVRHVLLAPIDRTSALRSAALRQMRFGLFVAVVVGAIAGQLAHRRLPGNVAAWVATGVLVTVLTVAGALGTALAASTWRLSRPLATVAALVLVASAGADAAELAPGPMRAAGGIALWPVRFEPTDLIAAVALAALAAVGLWFTGGQSIEAMERRSALVGQLRFAVTVQDLRTALVLQRQLAQDLPRTRPWLARARRRRSRFPVWHRTWIGLRRFPPGRLLRIVGCSVGAALSMVAVERGTTPMALVAAAAGYVAGLDLVEPMAQQIDQADRTDLLPLHRGVLLVRYLPALLVGAALAAVPGAVTAAVVAGPVAAALALPMAGCAVMAAVVSVGMQTPDATKDGVLVPPEIAGMKIAIRTAMPLLVSIVGTLPAIAVIKASDATRQQATINAAAASVFVMAAVAAWLRFGPEARAWWNQMLEQSQTNARAPRERTNG